MLSKPGRLISSLVAFSALTALSIPASVYASEHIDAPLLAQDRGADIADLWAFLDPNDNSKVVLIMSTQAFIVSGEHFGMGIFDHNIRYRFEIENTGDARPDAFIDVRYSPGLGRLTTQTATITLPNGHSFTAPTTLADQDIQPDPAPPPVITTDPVSGVSFYAGVADDPFFLDDTGANLFVASSLMHPGHPDKTLLGKRGRDTYAGFNTLITALSVPAWMLKGKHTHVIGINAVTQRQEIQRIREGGKGGVKGEGEWVTVDRDGNPLVNNGLIPAARKDEYNAATTDNDEDGQFRADIIKDLKNFGTDDAHIAKILKVVQENGDILRLDLTVPNSGEGGGDNPNGGFAHMGGRRLKDDVVDMVFTIINNGVLLSDHVNANDVPLRDKFPFVADPTQPFPPGQNPDDHTRQ
ncbi:MAG: hypothetical protein NVSMB6_10790 [Burkholderiaceae bacterium]